MFHDLVTKPSRQHPFPNFHSQLLHPIHTLQPPNSDKMMRKDFVTSSSYNRAIAVRHNFCPSLNSLISFSSILPPQAKDRRVGDSTSTAQDSYRTHATDSLKDGFQREKNAYNANKSKANHGGEWWGDSSANKVCPLNHLMTGSGLSKRFNPLFSSISRNKSSAGLIRVKLQDQLYQRWRGGR